MIPAERNVGGELDEKIQQQHFSLALSGGGVRAIAFHLGVLKYLAELTLLERADHVSSVSGGSLAIALMLASANRSWPNSIQFLSTVYPEVRQQVCSRSLVWDSVNQLRDIRNWKFLLSRANLLGEALHQNWGLDFNLEDLPTTPIWSINATTAENGKRFRFKGTTVGDWQEGYAHAPKLPVSTAVAVSAAFPGAIGPLSLKTMDYQWFKREWAAPESQSEKVIPRHKTLHLYDGGVYDNLGLEPLFDAGASLPKGGTKIIISSDAGAPLSSGFDSSPLSPWRLKRVADIMSDQARNLRVRTFVQYLKRTKAGAFIPIDSPLPGLNGDSDLAFVSSFPTTLRTLSYEEFDRIASHGYSVARATHKKFGLGISIAV